MKNCLESFMNLKEKENYKGGNLFEKISIRANGRVS